MYGQRYEIDDAKDILKRHGYTVVINPEKAKGYILTGPDGISSKLNHGQIISRAKKLKYKVPEPRRSK